MLIDYLPDYMRKYVEINEICSTEDVEIKKIEDYKNSIECEMFLVSAISYGLDRFERLFGIIPNHDEDIEFRKYRIYTKLLEEKNDLLSTLDEIIKNKRYEVSLDIDNLVLLIKVHSSNSELMLNIKEVIERIVPANVAIKHMITYNTHKYLRGFKHSQLGAYSHNDVRNKV